MVVARDSASAGGAGVAPELLDALVVALNEGITPFVRELGSLVRLADDGSFALDLSYFRHWSDGVQMTWDDGEPTLGRVYTEKLDALLGPGRRAASPGPFCS